MVLDGTAGENRIRFSSRESEYHVISDVIQDAPLERVKREQVRVVYQPVRIHGNGNFRTGASSGSVQVNLLKLVKLKNIGRSKVKRCCTVHVGFI